MKWKRIIQTGIVCAFFTFVCVESAKHSFFIQTDPEEETLETIHVNQNELEKPVKGEIDESIWESFEDMDAVYKLYLEKWKKILSLQDGIYALNRWEAEDRIKGFSGINNSGEIRLYYCTFDEDGVPCYHCTILQGFHENGRIYVSAGKMVDEGGQSSSEQEWKSQIPYFFDYGIAEEIGEKEGLTSYCMAELILEHWKNTNNPLLTDCSDPVFALKRLLHFPTDGKGTFYPVTTRQGLVEYEFPDGGVVDYLVNRRENLWFPDFQIDGAYVTRIKQSHEYVEQVTARRLMEIEKTLDLMEGDYSWYDLADDYVLLSELAEEDTALYGLYGGDAMVLRIQDEVYPFYMYWQSPQMIIPQLYSGDFDQDGKRDYVVKTHMKTGTGVSGDELFFIRRENDRIQIKEFEEEDWYGQLKRITYEYDEEYRVMQVKIDGEYAQEMFVTKEAAEEGGTCTGLDLSSIMSFTLYDNVWYLKVSPGLCMENWIGVPEYESGMEILSPIMFHPDGTFELGKIKMYQKAPMYSGFDEENPEHREKVVNVLWADVTHDGVDDEIVTSVTYWDEQENMTPEELLNKNEICMVRVYDGNATEWIHDAQKYAAKDGYYTNGALWEQELALAHVANGQVFLVEREGKYYIMYHSPWSGQGVGAFRYQVFSMDETGTVYDKDVRSFDFEYEWDGYVAQNNPPVEEAKEYADAVSEWVKNGKVVAITEVCEEPVISTFGKEKQYDGRIIWEGTPYEGLMSTK